jgi:hypothetical protein
MPKKFFQGDAINNLVLRKTSLLGANPNLHKIDIGYVVSMYSILFYNKRGKNGTMYYR